MVISSSLPSIHQARKNILVASKELNDFSELTRKPSHRDPQGAGSQERLYFATRFTLKKFQEAQTPNRTILLDN